MRTKHIFFFLITLLFVFSCQQNVPLNPKNNSKIVAINIASTSNIENQAKVVKECSINILRVYLNDPDTTGTNIRKLPGGTVITKLVKDNLNYEFFINISKAQDGWFKIESPIMGMENDIELPNNEGWIHGSVISVDTRNYSGQDLQLLDRPINGTVVGIIDKEEIGLTLKDICGSWVKVKCNDAVGWVESNWLCGNPLTNCS